MTYTRSINEIDIYSANILRALEERRHAQATVYMQKMIEHFPRSKVVNEIAILLKTTPNRTHLLNGIPRYHAFILLLESCNQKNDMVMQFLLLAYPIKEMSSSEFAKFIAWMLNNGKENTWIRNLIAQRKPEKLVVEMNQALFDTLKMSHKIFWANPETLKNISLLFEFGANLCSHVIELSNSVKVLDHILYAVIYDKQDIDLNLVKKLIQAGANIFAKNLSISPKTIYELLQDKLGDLTWLSEEKYLDRVKPEQLVYLIEKNHNAMSKNKLTQIFLKKRHDELKIFYQAHPNDLDKLLFNHVEYASKHYLGPDGDDIFKILIEWGANALRKYNDVSALDIATEQLRISEIHTILQKSINQITLSDQVKIYYLTYIEHKEISTLITHQNNLLRETVFNELKNPVVEQHFLKDMLQCVQPDYSVILHLGKRQGVNDRNRVFLLDFAVQYAKYELVSTIISDSKHLPQDKILNAIRFLLDERTENPLRFEHIKFLRLIHDTQLTDEEKKQWMAPLLFQQIHKAKTIVELMTIVDLLKLNKHDFKCLTSTPDMLKIAIKAMVSRMKEIAIIDHEIIFPDDMSYQKVLTFLKGVSSHSLYAKHDQDFNVLSKGKIVIAAKKESAGIKLQ